MNWRLTGAFFGRPLACSSLLNQRVLPAAIAVPLKLNTLEVALVDGVQRSSSSSRVGRKRDGGVERSPARRRADRRESQLIILFLEKRRRWEPTLVPGLSASGG